MNIDEKKLSTKLLKNELGLNLFEPSLALATGISRGTIDALSTIKTILGSRQENRKNPEASINTDEQNGEGIMVLKPIPSLVCRK